MDVQTTADAEGQALVVPAASVLPRRSRSATYSDEMGNDHVESMRHTAVLVVRVPEDVADWRVCFEPEGGDRVIASGERLTITMTGAGPREIEIHPYHDGLVIWRPLDSFDVTIIDQNGQPITDLW